MKLKEVILSRGAEHSKPGENNHKHRTPLHPLSTKGKQDYHRTLLIKIFLIIIVCVHVLGVLCVYRFGL